jgi:hypothetical protein
MTKAEQESWSERARIKAIERRYIEDPEERKELFKLNKEFIDTYMKDFSEMFGLRSTLGLDWKEFSPKVPIVEGFT